MEICLDSAESLRLRLSRTKVKSAQSAATSRATIDSRVGAWISSSNRALSTHQRGASSRRAVICCAAGKPAAYAAAISRPASVLGSGAPAAPSAILAST